MGGENVFPSQNVLLFSWDYYRVTYCHLAWHWLGCGYLLDEQIYNPVIINLTAVVFISHLYALVVGVSHYIQTTTACQAHPIPADRASLSQRITGTTSIRSIPTRFTQSGGHHKVPGRCGTSCTTGEHHTCYFTR